MVKKAFWKNNIKSIKKSFNRFLSMISIIFLSTAVITGLLVTSPNIKSSMSDKYIKQNTYDIELMIPKVEHMKEIAFNNESIEKLLLNENILEAEGFDILEVEAKHLNNKYNSKMYLYNFNNKINKFNIIESIENFNINNIKDDEIIIEKPSYYLIDINIGEKLTINDKDYKVVAIADNMKYYSKEAEKSLVNNKTFEIIIYKNELNLEYFSNIFITINKNNITDHFSKTYSNKLDEVNKQIKGELLNEILELRKDNLKNKYPFINEEMLKDLKIYILDKNTNISYQSFKNLIDKVDKITSIFPIFFLLVSALVVLTTMSRMIEEERQQIGILRSIGYSKQSIYFKYIFYAIIIGIIGTSLGYAAGFRLIPSIISNAFKTTFYVAPLNLNIYSLSNLVYIGIIVLSIVVVTIFSVRKTLNETASKLLLPKAPKYGTRILLEKINFIWKRLKFKYKSSLRNLFRYPKHFIMAVLGVMGSLALVFTGVSLTSAVDAITKRQYNNIFMYEYELTVKNFNDNELINYLETNNIEYLKIYEFGDIFETKKTNVNFYVTVKIIDGDISNFINLKNRTKRKAQTLSNNGVIITEQISTYLSKNIDDELKISSYYSLNITGITENYMENYVYMTKDLFDELNIDEQLTYKLLINDNELFNINDIMNFNSYNNHINIKDQLVEKNRQLNQVKLLAIVIVLAAVFLQVIIIYNLMNVNISERDKELSTLKVLGYNDLEVSKYIFREINILTSIGIILGIPLGIVLQRYVILSVDSPNIMLGRNFGWYSFLSSILLTIFMTIVVEVFMHYKIKKIDMISALKEL